MTKEGFIGVVCVRLYICGICVLGPMLNHQATSWLAAYVCTLGPPLVGVVNGKDPFGLTPANIMK